MMWRAGLLVRVLLTLSAAYRKFKSIFAPFPPPPAPAGGHAVLPARAAPPARCGRPAGAARSQV